MQPKDTSRVKDQIKSLDGNGQFRLEAKTTSGSDMIMTDNSFKEKSQVICEADATDQDIINGVLELPDTSRIYSSYDAEMLYDGFSKEMDQEMHKYN